MTPNPRQADLLEEVHARGSVSVEALAERFGVTLQTVRRDVKLLAEEGLLARFHGGVRVPSSTTENIAYHQRRKLNERAKRSIARAVAIASVVVPMFRISEQFAGTALATARAMLRLARSLSLRRWW